MQVVANRCWSRGCWIIAGGAAVASANYLFRASMVPDQGPGLGEGLITIVVNGQPRRVDGMNRENAGVDAAVKAGPCRHPRSYRGFETPMTVAIIHTSTHDLPTPESARKFSIGRWIGTGTIIRD